VPRTAANYRRAGEIFFVITSGVLLPPVSLSIRGASTPELCSASLALVDEREVGVPRRGDESTSAVAYGLRDSASWYCARKTRSPAVGRRKPVSRSRAVAQVTEAVLNPHQSRRSQRHLRKSVRSRCVARLGPRGVQRCLT